MPEVTLTAEKGRPTGSSATRRLRAAGQVPAVVYGHGMEPLVVSVNARDLRHVLSAHGLNQVLSLEVGGTKHLVLARQLQRHPVRHTVAHVDFQVVRRDEVVHASVAIVLQGSTTLVTREGGLVEQTMTSLAVRATPEHIPTEITVDVSEMTVGDVIRVGDLRLPPDVITEVSPEEVVVLAAASRVAAEVAEAEEAAAEAAAGETGAGKATPEGAAESASEEA
jgi:large subunit ribosomal protein L25